jgi:PAS domain S-box-containing protein
MSEVLRVLLVEDNPGDADLIREILPCDGLVSFEVQQAPRLATALQWVGERSFDIVLLDLGLPDSAGLDTVRAVHGQAPSLPIVVLTGSDDQRLALAAIQVGAQDYVVKGQTTGEFLSRILRYAHERHQNAQRLRESEESLAFALEASHTGAWDLDLLDDIIRRSLEHDRIFGYESPPPTWTYGRFLDHVLPEDRAGVEEEFRAAVAARGDVSFECRIQRADGELRWLRCTGRHRPSGTGPGRMAGIVQDITERRKAEAALRTSQEQLLQSQKMEAVGRLAGGIAHDFNNLLTVITGYCELLAIELPANKPALDCVGEIGKAAERAAQLTQQILAFSRRQPLQPKTLCLNDVVSEMEPLLRRTLGEDVELQTYYAPDLDVTEVDPHQFQQVLLNLAVNARAAMPAGGRLTVETANVRLDDVYHLTHPEMEPGAWVLLAVSDTGTGVPPEVLPHIFEPFFTTRAPGEGTGLGLSTAYGVVKQSGGHIVVCSEPGHGTRFEVLLPPAQGPAEALVQKQAVVRGSGGEETILVVEDEGSVRDLAERILTGRGYTVLTASGAAEGLALLADANRHVDLLLSDVVLPGGMQGGALGVAAGGLHPGLPIIYMSGYTRDAIVRAGRVDEGVNFLAKPFTSEALTSKIREVLDSRETDRLETDNAT